MNSITRTSAAVALCVSLAMPIAPALADTIDVTDALGRIVAVPEAPQRILLGFYFEDTFAVGGPDVYDRVVGISKDTWQGWRGLQWRVYADAVPRLEALADVGEVDAGTFSLEAALATDPDLAILAAWQYNALGDQVGRLEAAGIPVVVLDYNAQTVEKHVASTLALGKIFGEEERAQELADQYAGAVADVAARIADIADRPKVYVELGSKGAAEVGNSYGDTMWGRLVEMAGGTNLAKGQIATSGPLAQEYVLAQDPAHVFIAGSGWLNREDPVVMGPTVDEETTHAGLAKYLDRPGWSGLAAVKHGEVHGLYHGGARTLYDFVFLQYIAKALHPEAFADVDPDANLKAFFETYMPVPLSGLYITKLP